MPAQARLVEAAGVEEVLDAGKGALLEGLDLEPLALVVIVGGEVLGLPERQLLCAWDAEGDQL